MNFDWQAFCTQHDISFITTSARGNIHIVCPQCASNDGDHHMGLSLNRRRPFWGCWKNSDHRGRHPAFLVALLLNCTREAAVEIVAAGDTSAVDEYEALVNRVAADPVVEKTPPQTALKVPKEFKQLDQRYYGGKYVRYLEGRGFHDPLALAEEYPMRYCTVGTFKQRLVLLLHDGGKLVGWTGRDITKRARLRYATLSDKAEVAEAQGYPAALRNVKDILYNSDEAAEGGRVLVLCEGPLDALKVNAYAPAGVVAVAAFGMPTLVQVGRLAALSKRFDRVAILLDSAATLQSFQAVENMQMLTRRAVCQIQYIGKDPGSLSAKQIRTLCATL